MKHTYTSDLDQADLRVRLEHVLHRCTEKYSAHHFEWSWNSEQEASLNLRTPIGRVRATAQLDGERINFSIALPLAMRLLAGQVRAAIDAEMAEG